MNKGFVLSFEATLTLILFSLFLLITPLQIQNQNDYLELIILQQENDFLKIWSTNFSPVQMALDVKNNFDNATLIIDNITLVSGKPTKNSVASSAILLDNFLIEHKVTIIVYY